MESVFRVSIERVRNTHKNTEKRMDETNVACIQSLCEDDYNLAASILAKQKTSDTTRLDTQTQAGHTITHLSSVGRGLNLSDGRDRVFNHGGSYERLATAMLFRQHMGLTRRIQEYLCAIENNCAFESAFLSNI